MASQAEPDRRCPERGESTVITRRGKRVACISPVKRAVRGGLPDLTSFHDWLKVTGKPLSRLVIEARKSARR